MVVMMAYFFTPHLYFRPIEDSGANDTSRVLMWQSIKTKEERWQTKSWKSKNRVKSKEELGLNEAPDLSRLKN